MSCKCLNITGTGSADIILMYGWRINSIAEQKPFTLIITDVMDVVCAQSYRVACMAIISPNVSQFLDLPRAQMTVSLHTRWPTFSRNKHSEIDYRIFTSIIGAMGGPYK